MSSNWINPTSPPPPEAHPTMRTSKSIVPNETSKLLKVPMKQMTRFFRECLYRGTYNLSMHGACDLVASGQGQRAWYDLLLVPFETGTALLRPNFPESILSYFRRWSGEKNVESGKALGYLKMAVFGLVRFPKVQVVGVLSHLSAHYATGEIPKSYWDVTLPDEQEKIYPPMIYYGSKKAEKQLIRVMVKGIAVCSTRFNHSTEQAVILSAMYLCLRGEVKVVWQVLHKILDEREDSFGMATILRSMDEIHQVLVDQNNLSRGDIPIWGAWGRERAVIITAILMLTRNYTFQPGDNAGISIASPKETTLTEDEHMRFMVNPLDCKHMKFADWSLLTRPEVVKYNVILDDPDAPVTVKKGGRSPLEDKIPDEIMNITDEKQRNAAIEAFESRILDPKRRMAILKNMWDQRFFPGPNPEQKRGDHYLRLKQGYAEYAESFFSLIVQFWSLGGHSWSVKKRMQQPAQFVMDANPEPPITTTLVLKRSSGSPEESAESKRMRRAPPTPASSPGPGSGSGSGFNLSSSAPEGNSRVASIMRGNRLGGSTTLPRTRTAAVTRPAADKPLWMQKVQFLVNVKKTDGPVVIKGLGDEEYTANIRVPSLREYIQSRQVPDPPKGTMNRADKKWIIHKTPARAPVAMQDIYNLVDAMALFDPDQEFLSRWLVYNVDPSSSLGTGLVMMTHKYVENLTAVPSIRSVIDDYPFHMGAMAMWKFVTKDNNLAADSLLTNRPMEAMEDDEQDPRCFLFRDMALENHPQYNPEQANPPYMGQEDAEALSEFLFLEETRELFMTLVKSWLERTVKYDINEVHPVVRNKVEALRGDLLEILAKVSDEEMWDEFAQEMITFFY